MFGFVQNRGTGRPEHMAILMGNMIINIEIQRYFGTILKHTLVDVYSSEDYCSC